MRPHMDTFSTDDAPAAIGPYSQAVATSELVFLSGQIALDPATGEIVPGGVEAQTRRVLENMRAVLQAAGCGLGSVVRCTVYMKDLEAFAEMNAVYGEFFRDPHPARAAVEVARLPKDGLVEIDAIAVRPSQAE